MKVNRTINMLVIATLLSINFGVAFSIGNGGKELEIYYAQILLLITLFFMIILNRFNMFFPKSVFTILLLLFNIYVFTSNIWSINLGQNMSSSIFFFYGLLSFFLFVNILNEHISILFFSLRFFGIFLVIYMVVKLYINYRTLTYIDLSFYSLKHLVETPLGASNYLAIYLESLLVLEIIAKHKSWKIVSTIYFFGLLLTFSRTGYILIIMISIIYILINFQNNKVKKVFLILAITIGSTLFISRINERIEAFSSVTSVETRLNIWKMNWKIFEENFILGQGYTFSKELNSHNIILSILVSYGLIGFILCLSLVSSVIFRFSINNQTCFIIYKKLNLGIFMSLTIIFLHSLFEPFFFNPVSQIYIGLLISVLYLNNNNI